MSDSPKARAEIPPWQRQSDPENLSSQPNSAMPEQDPISTRDARHAAVEDADERSISETGVRDVTTLDQARKFLQEPAVQNAARDQKIEFLKLKGVSSQDVKTILDTQQDSKSQQRPSGVPHTTGNPRHSPQSRSPQDIPPVVTYPEFLVQARDNPPLITAQRLLYTLYFTGGLIAAFYGLSKYVVQPLIEDLTEARHDFAVHTQTWIQELNERMRKMVSKIPQTNQATSVKDIDTASDISAAESDPTELYHRDFGTQTSPNLSRRPSAVQNDETAIAPGAEALAAGHEKRLEIMRMHITDLVDDGKREDLSIADGKSVIKDLSQYLDTLTYPVLNYSNYNYDGIYGSDNGSKTGKDDATDSVKKEIRSIKGVLLSARNFPGVGKSAGKSA
ncbi:MAG: hypothetical protein M1821_003560 [Bathelium mastoideum]|nr:MAG: hypothetical protein M1821_003560 [Bathelium mastoideum]KAI9684848.1 MAG: hypothetical protein M1822_005496 [Bathelium mastoideum]